MPSNRLFVKFSWFYRFYRSFWFLKQQKVHCDATMEYLNMQFYLQTLTIYKQDIGKTRYRYTIFTGQREYLPLMRRSLLYS